MRNADCCVDCIYYKRETGRCLRYPPSLNGEDKNGEPYYGSPLVRPQDWCGEFKRDETEVSKATKQEVTSNAEQIAEIPITKKANHPEEKSALDKGKEFLKSFLPDGKKDK